MPPENEINPIQASIMQTLFRQGPLRFAELNRDGIPSDQFSYHLRQLLHYGLIEKNAGNAYELSVTGKSRAILLAEDAPRYIDQGFIAVRVVLTRQAEGQLQVLVQERTKATFRHALAAPGGKLLYGDNVVEAAQKIMGDQTGLTCDLAVRGLVHFKDSHNGLIVQDKYFFVLRATNPRGALKAAGDTGRNLWLGYEEVVSSPQAHDGLREIMDMALADSMGFAEATFEVKEY